MSTWHHRIESLSHKQREILARAIDQRNRGPRKTGAKRLAAFVIADQEIDIKELQKFLEERLPDFMRPGFIKQLDQLPRLPNGKLDTKQLTNTVGDLRSSVSHTAIPASKTEQALVEIWERVLNLSPIHVDDNFFEVGGDSILSIQIIAQARKVGITLAPNQLFEHQTIRELAAVAQVKQETTVDFTPAAPGPAAMSPIQHWFFSGHISAPHYWNQILEFKLESTITYEAIRGALEMLVARHDSLRLAFKKVDDNWKMELKEETADQIVSEVDLTKLNEGVDENFILSSIASAQETYDMENGNIFRAIWFKTKDDLENRLYMICHHLATDAYSWKIVAEEFSTIIKSLQEGNSPDLPNPTTPYTVYSNWLVNQADNQKIEKELEFWAKQVKSNQPFPVDFDSPFPVPESSIKVVQSQMAEETTNMLLHNLSTEVNIKPRELLIAAFMLAIYDWRNISDICLGLEGHGRDESDDGIDLSRTVGWLTTYYPIKLRIGDGDNLDHVLSSVKEQLNAVPGTGLGYGILRYLANNSSLAFNPPVVFNYLGNLNQIEANIIGNPTYLKDTSRHPESERHYHIEVNAMINNGVLETHWSYSESQYKNDTIQQISVNFERRVLQLVEWCAENSKANNNSVDFPEVNLSKGDLDNLLNQL